MLDPTESACAQSLDNFIFRNIVGVLGSRVVFGVALFGARLVEGIGRTLFLIGLGRLMLVFLFLSFLLEFFEFI